MSIVTSAPTLRQELPPDGLLQATPRPSATASSNGCRMGPPLTAHPSVPLPLQRVSGKPRQEHRIAGGEPADGQKEQPAEQQRDTDLREAERGAGAAVDRGDDLKVTLEPDAGEAHEREGEEDRRGFLRLHAEQADRSEEHTSELQSR